MNTFTDQIQTPVCTTCTYPATTLLPGSISCTAFCVCLSSLQLGLVSIGLVAFFASGVVASGEKSLALITFTLMPALDTISNTLYLLQTRFYSPLLFALVVTFHFLQNWIFVKRMVEIKALLPGFLLPPPSFLRDGSLLWLGRDVNTKTKTLFSWMGWPTYHGKRLSCTFDKHDTLTKLFVYWVVWISCIFSQFFCVIALLACYVPIYAFHIPFWCIWALIGGFVCECVLCFLVFHADFRFPLFLSPCS